MVLTPTERSLRARIGAYALHALYDRYETTKAASAAARSALNARLLNEIDPDNSLSPEERDRRLGYARKAHFAVTIPCGTVQIPVE